MRYASAKTPVRVRPAVVAVLVVLGLALGAGVPATAQDLDSKGTDFWLAFPGNAFCCGIPTLSLFITGDTATTGTVEAPGLAFSTPFTVTPGAVTTVPIPFGAHLTTFDGVEDKGIHVSAADEVTVYGLNRIEKTTDAYLGLPTGILGTEYMVLGYKNSDVVNGTEFAVVGTANGTTVTITPSVTTGSHAAGVAYDVMLNQGQTYQLINSNAAPSDLSGTTVTSTNPIAVFGGHNCANIPPTFVACDHVIEQLPPTSAWGTRFATMPLATRVGGDTFRFIASTDGTTVHVNGSAVATLNRGELHERIINGPAHITSDKPVLVAQYSNSGTFDGVTSDPFMMLIPPYEQFLAGYTVTTPASGFASNFANVVAPVAAVGLITLDGAAIPAAAFTSIGSSGFSGAQLRVALGTHNLEGPLPFGAFMYGFGSFDSYGYPGGMSLAPIARVTTITLAPETGLNPVGAQHCVFATVRDQDGNPLQGIRVDFNITGPNSMAGFGSTDASGVAEFCYTGTAVGNDTIVASVGNVVSNTATKAWSDNQPPDLTGAAPTQACFWPPEHQFESVGITGITDPDGDPLTVTITGITSDEATTAVAGAGGEQHAPDAAGIGSDTASIRVERSGESDGRVYRIWFDVSDRQETVRGSVPVGVPRDESGGVCGVDSGQNYDATVLN